MALLMFDSASPWDAARVTQAKKAGAIALSVYIVGSPGNMRCANKADVDLVRSSGLGVVPNWERAANFFATCSMADAKYAGTETLAACRALGLPDDGSIDVPFSFDFQVPPARFGEMRDKLAYARDGLGGHYGAVGYGQTALIDYWATHGLPGPHWLMASTWDLPYNPASPNVAVVQSHDVNGNWLTVPVPGTDTNTVTQPTKLRAWWPDGSPYGGDMALSNEDKTWISNAIHDTTQDLLARLATTLLTGRLDPQFTSSNAPDLIDGKGVRGHIEEVLAAVQVLQVAGVDPVAVAREVIAHLDLQVVAK